MYVINWKNVTGLGAFHLVKFPVGSSHWKIPRKSGKSKKVGPFSRLEFPNGMSCSIYVSRSLYQFQVHSRAPRRTGAPYDQMEQLFINRKFHFWSHRNFWVFFLNGKRPGCQSDFFNFFASTVQTLRPIVAFAFSIFQYFRAPWVLVKIP